MSSKKDADSFMGDKATEHFNYKTELEKIIVQIALKLRSVSLALSLRLHTSDSHSTHSFPAQLARSTPSRSIIHPQQETLPADMDLATGKNDRIGNGMGAPGTLVNLIPVASNETCIHLQQILVTET
ncbi:8946_t:CDS:2 [Paraglomus brasilianum]|uniref:8946_t:CDS:1 n=1 Tax=Paraglomus brasilianum TaxID=144538 RepID=A0A9N9GZF4_9GLOM|nr:8946_t:CDS:2 [Paraglomus brasilianum]